MPQRWLRFFVLQPCDLAAFSARDQMLLTPPYLSLGRDWKKLFMVIVFLCWALVCVLAFVFLQERSQVGGLLAEKVWWGRSELLVLGRPEGLSWRTAVVCVGLVLSQWVKLQLVVPGSHVRVLTCVPRALLRTWPPPGVCPGTGRCPKYLGPEHPGGMAEWSSLTSCSLQRTSEWKLAYSLCRSFFWSACLSNK